MSDNDINLNNRYIFNSPVIRNKKSKFFFSPTENNEFQLDNNINITPNKKIIHLSHLNLSKFSKKKKYKISSRDNSILINSNTLVFSLPYISNDIKNKKNKNYEKIVLELKHLFHIWTDNKSNVNTITHNRKNNKIINQKYNSRESDLIYDIFYYINIIKKNPRDRTLNDLYMIVNCLSNTKLGKYFKEEFDDNKEIFQKLITLCSVEIQHRKFYKGQKIFNIGDMPDYFYIILHGKIDIVKPMQKKVNISGNQYFCYLMNLLKINDNYTFNLCIENNKYNFAIKKEDLKKIPYIFISINLEKINMNYPIDFNEVLSIIDMKPIDFDLNENKIYDNNYIKQNTDKIKNFFPYKINSDLIEKYYFIFDKNEKNDVIIYDNVKFLSLETNDYFGDSALDSKTTRNATIIASEDTDVGFLEMGLYSSNLAEEKSKIIKKQLIVLLKNFYFNKINPKKFEKKYFGYFIRNIYKKGDIVFKEDEKPQFVYFIEDGRVELSTTKNILEMQKTIDILEKKLRNIKTIINTNSQKNDTDNEKNDKNEKNNKKKEKDEELLYSKVNTNFLDLMEHLNKKEIKKVLILKTNEDIGTISFYFDYPYITDCIVTSYKAKIFKIDIKYLNEIMNNEKNCLNDLNEKVKYKLQMFHDRLFNINNIKLLLADYKEHYKLEEIKKNEKKIKLDRLLHKHDIIYNKIKKDKNKTIINIKKFKELHNILINKQIENNNENISKINNNIKWTLPSIKSERVFIINNYSPYNKNKFESQSRKDWRNRTINNKIFNRLINKENNIKLFDLNNKSEKQIFKERKHNYYDDDISLKNKNSINIKSNNSENKNKINKNDSFILYFEKYFNNKNIASKTPLIFSKKIINFENDKNSNTERKNSNLDINNNVKSNSNIFSTQNKYLRISRNNNNSLNNNINFFSSYKNTNNSNNNDTMKKIFSILKTKNKSKFQNKNSFYDLTHPLTKSKLKNKKNIINSYVDKKSKNNFVNKTKHIDHPYYSPMVLTKREKYKIFCYNDEKKNKKKEKFENINKSINNLRFFPSENMIINNANSENIKYRKIL